MREQYEARAETIYPREHVGDKNPPPRGCGCDECFLNEARRMAYIAGCVDQAERMREGNAVVMQHAEDRVSAYKRQIRLDALRIASLEVDHAHLTATTAALFEDRAPDVYTWAQMVVAAAGARYTRGGGSADPHTPTPFDPKEI